MADRFAPSPARGKIFVDQSGAQAEPWVRGRVRNPLPPSGAGEGCGEGASWDNENKIPVSPNITG